jgi:type IX secretion system PorP/SprF family membrane protein
VIQDKIAITNTIGFDALFAYHIGFGKGKLSFGIEGGGIKNFFNYDYLTRITAVDPAIPVGDQSTFVPDVSSGIFYQSDQFYVGGSVYHLLNSKRTLLMSENNMNYVVAKTYSSMGGVFIELKRNIILEPSFLIKYVKGAPVQVDINTSLVYVDKMAFGLSYRTGDALIAMFKFDITKNLKVVYSYDYTLSRLSKFSYGNHELSISYGVELLPPPSKRVIHPRYYF